MTDTSPMPFYRALEVLEQQAQGVAAQDAVKVVRQCFDQMQVKCDAAVNAAVLAEREACAEIAWRADKPEADPYARDAYLLAASDIRRGILARYDTPAPVAALTPAAASLPPEPPPGHLRVKINCVVNAYGECKVWGNDFFRLCSAGERLSWITADVPLPAPAAEITGKVS